MPKIRNLEDLREAIRDLEHQNYVNEQHMRQKVAEIADRLKPVNLLKSVFSNLFGGRSEVKTSLFRMAAGLITSFVVKKYFKKGIAK
ncbi:hypothetical protein Q4E93_08395 [Flavitalea sp. BT771]|uniref:hypothetical protein n=1 Tax=Flavitalea sp. BT771 TaxID=3063329 RepID=UPI0026E413AF|nr:hypothetical protein [Flavitalea sp. BT771]MDO6430603.1 hypothetical protein [Flavitalea sp. BT771]MDV6219257.1 hypothetical protein [Flavitalea sp. BT771]